MSGPATVTWQISATGTDELGRTFQTQVAQVNVTSPPVEQPRIGGANRIELWGGRNYSQFLGCMNCGQFDSESVSNRFGDYGSRFSSTSIWNRFSDYGSRLSSDSACNEFASNPPVMINPATRTFMGELTLNRAAGPDSRSGNHQLASEHSVRILAPSGESLMRRCLGVIRRQGGQLLTSPNVKVTDSWKAYEDCLGAIQRFLAEIRIQGRRGMGWRGVFWFSRSTTGQGTATK